MKNIILLLSMILSVSSYAGPRVVGNGGGGVYENGVYKTFYSAGVLVNPREETNIPGMNLLNDTLLSMTEKDTIFPTFLPSEKRIYYRIVESDLNQKNIERLIEEYRRVIKQSDNIAIFAITDINEKTTYLLPSFYQLTEVEQAAILFHEAYWIMNPKATYLEVVKNEIAFQEYVEGVFNKVYHSEFPRILGKIVSDKTLNLRMSLQFDIENQTAPALISKDGIKLLDIYPNGHKCSLNSSLEKESRVFNRKQYSVPYIYCDALEKAPAQLYYIELEKKYPKSVFVKELRSRALSTQRGFRIFSSLFLYKKEEVIKYIESLGLDPQNMNKKENERVIGEAKEYFKNYRINNQSVEIEKLVNW